MGRQGSARPVPRSPGAREFEEPLYAVAVTPVGREESFEALVVDLFARQGEADVLCDVVVTEAHRVGVAERHVRNLCRGPHADPRHGPQPGAYEKSIGVEYFDELAVMVDTFRPLDLGEGGVAADDPSYAWSWSKNS